MALQTITLGDATTLTVPMRSGGTAFTPAAGYQLIFTAKLATSDLDAAAVIQKKSGGFGLTESGSNAIVALLPIDTSSLAGDITLHCDIQAQNLSDAGDIKTVNVFRLLTVRDVTRETDVSITVYTTEPPTNLINTTEIVTGDFTAVVGVSYSITANAIVTDPASAVEGDRYYLYFANGVGGTFGGFGQMPRSRLSYTRVFESGAWITISNLN